MDEEQMQHSFLSLIGSLDKHIADLGLIILDLKDGPALSRGAAGALGEGVRSLGEVRDCVRGCESLLISKGKLSVNEGEHQRHLKDLEEFTSLQGVMADILEGKCQTN